MLRPNSHSIGSKRYLSIGALLLILPTVLLLLVFQNFSSFDDRGPNSQDNSQVPTWEATTYSVRPLSNKPAQAVAICQGPAWTLVLNLEGISDGEIFDGSITSDSGEPSLNFQSARIPLTEGHCRQPADSGQIKVCLENADAYSYLVHLTPRGTQSAQTIQHFTVVRELGCEESPQIVKVPKRK